MLEVQSFVGLGIPVSLDFGVQLKQQFSAPLRTGPAQTILGHEEVDAQIGLANDGIIDNGKTADASELC